MFNRFSTRIAKLEFDMPPTSSTNSAGEIVTTRIEKLATRLREREDFREATNAERQSALEFFRAYFA